jgi:hypothetical protein
MNIQDMSPDFIDMLTPEQMATLLKDIAAKTEEEPERISKTVEKKDTSSFMVSSKKSMVGSRVPVQGTGENLFTDDGTLFKDKKNKDNVTPEINLSTKGVREAPKMQDVTCNMCHKTFEKREDLIAGNYHICHKCGGNK